MQENIRTHLAALNIAWQRYARALEQQLDTVPMSAFHQDYLAAWEGLDACGIAEWMLIYDEATLTFSLPSESLADLMVGSDEGADAASMQLI